MKKLIFGFGLIISVFGFFSVSSIENPETIIVDEDGYIQIFEDGLDCVIHLGSDPWSFGDDC